jgi:hypothetical protein
MGAMAWAGRCWAARSNHRGGVSPCRTRKRGETRLGSSRSTQTLPTVIVTVSKGNRDCPNVMNVLLLQEQYDVSGDLEWTWVR